MLNATITYDAPTNTVTVLDTATDAVPYYRLVRRRAGRMDEVISAVAYPHGLLWKPQADGCPALVLQSGNYPDYDPDASADMGEFVADDESELLYLPPAAQQSRHTAAIADNYGKYAQRHPQGHPLNDVLLVLARRMEAGYMFDESNPQQADALLTTTQFPR